MKPELREQLIWQESKSVPPLAADYLTHYWKKTIKSEGWAGRAARSAGEPGTVVEAARFCRRRTALSTNLWTPFKSRVESASYVSDVHVTEVSQEKVDELTTRFTHYDEVFRDDPVPVWNALRDRCPVVRGEDFGGFWALLRYRDIVRAATDPKTFSTKYGTALPWLGNPLPALPTEAGPGDHEIYRSIIAPFFSPKRVAVLEPLIRALVTESIDAVIEKGEADLAEAIARPIPPEVLARFMGLPASKTTDFRRWVEGILVKAIDGDMEGLFTLVGEMIGYFLTGLENAKVAPGDDLATLLVQARFDGRPLTDDEMAGFCFSLAVAGHETATSGLGNSLLLLAQRPAVRQALMDRPTLVVKAVEEFLRLDPPVPGFARTVDGTPVTFGDVTMDPGSKLMLMWVAGNHDAEEFPDPDEVVFDRPTNRHLTFGFGNHRCPGAPLARLQLRVVIEEVVRRLPDYEIAGPVERTVGLTHGVTKLPVRFTPGLRELAG